MHEVVGRMSEASTVVFIRAEESIVWYSGKTLRTLGSESKAGCGIT